jgi:uncharacterized cupin superfamily protein
MLQHGYWIADKDKMPKPILEKIPVSNVSANSTGRVYDTANCTADIDEIPAGASFFWFFTYDEIHHVLKGEAEITYSLASTSHTVKKVLNVKQGDFYIAPLGSRLTWKVSPAGPLKLFSVAIPGLPLSTPSRSEIARQAGR